MRVRVGVRPPLLVALLTAAIATAAVAGADEASSLIERLRAPCCWQQTLDVHASPIADELRVEIHRRIEAGESSEAVEADLVKRYGERIRAIPREGFLTPLGVFGLMAAILGLIATVSVGVRMSRRGAQASDAAPVAAVAAPADTEAARMLRAQLDDMD